MTDIHMQRDHNLGLPAARKLASQWIEQAETRLGMRCSYAQGLASDEIAFERSGVSGTVQVTENSFVLNAELGFLLSAFKDKIETEVAQRLDTLLAQAG